jgi:hypothetical protein
MSKQVATFDTDSGKCKGRILADANNWVFTVQGQYKGTGVTELKYMAAAPPDLRQSYMGSGLPFATADMAYEGSPNKGETKIAADGTFSFTVIRPNAYYVNNGSKMVNPHVHFTIGKEYFDVALGVGNMQNRSLTGLPGRPERSTHR